MGKQMRKMVKNKRFIQIPSTSNLWDGSWEDYYKLDSCRYYLGNCIYGKPCEKCPLMEKGE